MGDSRDSKPDCKKVAISGDGRTVVANVLSQVSGVDYAIHIWRKNAQDEWELILEPTGYESGPYRLKYEINGVEYIDGRIYQQESVVTRGSDDSLEVSHDGTVILYKNWNNCLAIEELSDGTWARKGSSISKSFSGNIARIRTRMLNSAGDQIILTPTATPTADSEDRQSEIWNYDGTAWIKTAILPDVRDHSFAYDGSDIVQSIIAHGACTRNHSHISSRPFKVVEVESNKILE